MSYIGYKEGNIYDFSKLEIFLQESIFKFDVEVVGNNKVEYYNIPSSFDIETSNFIENGKKFSTMYIWQFGLNGSVIYGRTWKEFTELISRLTRYMHTSEKKRLLVYVHNLAYEFQFINKLFKWKKVFAPHNRRPIYALMENGIEFRCSYYLSNFSLEYIGDNLLLKYPVKKLVGSLDYNKIRLSITPLTSEELNYCINDVKVVMSYIQEKIENDGNIMKIPLTNTGYVRNYCRKNCFKFGSDKKAMFEYHSIMKSLKISSIHEYKMLRNAFRGGFTHASAMHSGKTLHEVGSADLTSSYPFTMVALYFPMSRSTYIQNPDINKLVDYLSKYCCLFNAKFTNLRPKIDYENYAPFHKSYKEKALENNGRVVSADTYIVTLTELDFDIINRTYVWDNLEISDLYIYQKSYLPKSLILSILSLYEMKTRLKGVEGKELEYLIGKGMLNSTYGMAVTSIIRDNWVFDIQWEKVFADEEMQLKSYNNSFTRFLFYPWGIWVTAHARHNLWLAILEFKGDYVYSDTDSIKGINFFEHMGFFDRYNNQVKVALMDMCDYYKIPFEKCSPKTNKGVEKMLGVWEIEESYSVFKTIGAKRYMYNYSADNYFNVTIAGINKKIAVPYMIAKWNDISFDSKEFKTLLSAYNPNSVTHNEDKKAVLEKGYSYEMCYETFHNGLYFPPEFSGRIEACYNDEEISGTLVDYLGNVGKYHELSCTYLGNSPYFISVPREYEMYCRMLLQGKLAD